MIRILFGFALFLLLSTGCENIGEQHHHNLLLEKPNVVVILTSGDRFPQHWPKEWEEKHLLARERLKKHGLSFMNAFTASCGSEPSRKVMLTGFFHNAVPALDIESILSEKGGYEVFWNGKWPRKSAAQEEVLEYIEKVGNQNAASRKPFCIFVSLNGTQGMDAEPVATREKNLGIKLPSNFNDDLSKKPSIQLKARDEYNLIAPLKDESEQIDYVNYYAYLVKEEDKKVGIILDALENAGLSRSTVIILTSDHGELALSHGMRGSGYCAYEEVIHIPLVISNPNMFLHDQVTDSFYSHVDFLPTLLELCGIPAPMRSKGGVSLLPVIRNPSTSVREAVLFAFDDQILLPENTPHSHIRAIRDKEWMYAVYYSMDGTSFEAELYQLNKDPDQVHNLISKTMSEEHLEEAFRLHHKLKEKIFDHGDLPKGFPLSAPGSR